MDDRKVAAVLAGGVSRRMGRPKAMLELNGRSLISYPLEALREAGFEPIVVAKPDTPLPELDAELGVRVVREPEQPRHPLLGIVTALREANGPVLVCGCDMPFLTAELLAFIGSLGDPLVVPEAEGRLHPLLGRYSPELLPALEEGLEAENPLSAVASALGPRLIGEEELQRFGDPERLLFNVNSPADLERAVRMVAEPA
jgi:molybdopterin-guanine dinucleotide biosynthesis protein A